MHRGGIVKLDMSFHRKSRSRCLKEPGKVVLNVTDGQFAWCLHTQTLMKSQQNACFKSKFQSLVG